MQQTNYHNYCYHYYYYFYSNILSSSRQYHITYCYLHDNIFFFLFLKNLPEASNIAHGIDRARRCRQTVTVTMTVTMTVMATSAIIVIVSISIAVIISIIIVVVCRHELKMLLLLRLRLRLGDQRHDFFLHQLHPRTRRKLHQDKRRVLIVHIIAVAIVVVAVVGLLWLEGIADEFGRDFEAEAQTDERQRGHVLVRHGQRTRCLKGRLEVEHHVLREELGGRHGRAAEVAQRDGLGG